MSLWQQEIIERLDGYQHKRAFAEFPIGCMVRCNGGPLRNKFMPSVEQVDFVLDDCGGVYEQSLRFSQGAAYWQYEWKPLFFRQPDVSKLRIDPNPKFRNKITASFGGQDLGEVVNLKMKKG